MRLTRRDALAVLAGLGVTGGAVSLTQFDPPTADSTGKEGGSTGEDGSGGDDTPPTAVRDTMAAAAEVVYPSAAEGVSEFVEAYVVGRARDDSRRAAMADAATELDDVARDWEGAAFGDLPAADRDRLLRELGVDAADPIPDGTLSERLRFHVVNELLYAFYASPTGGRLVGIENPIGHPGGAGSYRRATMDGSETTDSGGETDG
ncbi:Tat (twin-arginine translocation) pathway signal sequence [Haloferax sp. Atlit-10N]|uniref:gluconate 2-dehydrogenase subunit 3 family protein n=1 Tax=unclassified Haloferax TaxID=2625095 RepID=UPI000E239F6B|nr:MULTISPECIES: gluconate 2-dehydrogenase subunit 3 family protein [unclassified Haloferax]RDZ47020.1 Tat (twin-arginine translocation) pathway signal sequence [Haloferax sp. Atlit-16N]RDZ60851.1 Tat (twin-arginine translocation) pathway signal sequence [Haloferax sp. Atlit-10N]